MNFLATAEVYLRDGSAETIGHAATPKTLQIKLCYPTLSQYTGTWQTSPTNDHPTQASGRGPVEYIFLKKSRWHGSTEYSGEQCPLSSTLGGRLKAKPLRR